MQDLPWYGSTLRIFAMQREIRCANFSEFCCLNKVWRINTICFSFQEWKFMVFCVCKGGMQDAEKNNRASGKKVCRQSR